MLRRRSRARERPERKWTVDYGGAVKLIEAAKQAGIGRYLMVSSIGADPEHEGDEVVRGLPARQGQGGRGAGR